MKITLQKESAMKALARVSGFINTKDNVVVLRSAKLVATDSLLTMRGGDASRQDITAAVGDVEIRSPGSVLVDPVKLADILRNASESAVRLTLMDKGVLLVASGRATWKLPTESVDEYPPAMSDVEPWFVMPASTLHRALEVTIYCTDDESSRYALGGVAMFSPGRTGGTMDFVGTDGRRLAACAVAAEFTPREQPIILPKPACRLLMRLLNELDANTPIAVGTNGSRVMATLPTASVCFGLIEGRFPKYEAIFAKADTLFAAPCQQLTQIVKQAAIVANAETRAVDFTIDKEQVTAAARSADSGAAQIEMPIAGPTESVKFALSSRYLLEMLANFSDTAEVTVSGGRNESAVFFNCDGCEAVVMPLSESK